MSSSKRGGPVWPKAVRPKNVRQARNNAILILPPGAREKAARLRRPRAGAARGILPQRPRARHLAPLIASIGRPGCRVRGPRAEILSTIFVRARAASRFPQNPGLWKTFFRPSRFTRAPFVLFFRAVNAAARR